MLFMDNQVNRFILLAVFISHSFMLSAQDYQGTTGLLHVPSAEMAAPGTFRGNMSFIHRKLLPEELWSYADGKPFNTMTYTIGITAFSWLELSYASTLVKIYPSNDRTKEPGFYNQDRHVNLKIRPLKEGPWWPAVAIGWDDVGNWESYVDKASFTANNFFENIYVTSTKHFDMYGHHLGVHLAYRYYQSTKSRTHHGVVGGITVVPSISEIWQENLTWMSQPRFIMEWDGAGVNIGADVLLWRHLFIQACIVHGSGFMGGLSYHYTIRF